MLGLLFIKARSSGFKFDLNNVCNSLYCTGSIRYVTVTVDFHVYLLYNRSPKRVFVSFLLACITRNFGVLRVELCCNTNAYQMSLCSEPSFSSHLS